MVWLLLLEFNPQFFRGRLTAQRLLSRCNGGWIKVRIKADSLVALSELLECHLSAMVNFLPVHYQIKHRNQIVMAG